MPPEGERLTPGQPVRIGVRPQDLIAVEPGAADGRFAFEAAIEVVEPIGATSLLHLDLAGQAITATHDGRSLPRPGDRMTVACGTDSLHLFDPETGLALIRR